MSRLLERNLAVRSWTDRSGGNPFRKRKCSDFFVSKNLGHF